MNTKETLRITHASAPSTDAARSELLGMQHSACRKMTPGIPSNEVCPMGSRGIDDQNCGKRNARLRLYGMVQGISQASLQTSTLSLQQDTNIHKVPPHNIRTSRPLSPSEESVPTKSRAPHAFSITARRKHIVCQLRNSK